MTHANTSRNRLSTRQICAISAMGTIVCFMTAIPRIPIPLGYAHLGNAAIFLAVTFVGRREGIFAGCIGSALADLIGGFPLWVGPTLIIKFLMADTFWRVALKNVESPAGTSEASHSSSNLRTIAGLVLAGLVMAAGYTAFGALLYDSIEAGLASTPGLLMEGAVNAIVFFFAKAALQRAGVTRYWK